MSKSTRDQMTETHTEGKPSAALKEDELDGISGGPHYATFDSIRVDPRGAEDIRSRR